ncbi:hypothetical protein D3C79_1094530 [compost metagenome]
MIAVDLANTGDKNSFSICEPPSTSGIPTKPPTTERTAKMINGIVIDAGDSCK